MIPPEDFTVEQKKRSDRRVEINRPKRGVNFALDNNMTREFRISDIVQKDELAKSSERNQPKTEGRRVILKPTEVAEPDSTANQSDEDTKVSFTEDSSKKVADADAAPAVFARVPAVLISESE